MGLTDLYSGITIYSGGKGGWKNDLMAEYCVISASGGFSSNLLVGGRWQVGDSIRVDAGYSLALNDNSSNIATLCLTTEF